MKRPSACRHPLARLPSRETSFSNTSVLLKGTGSTLIPLSFHCHQQIFLNLTTMRRRHSRTRQKLASMLRRRAPKLITFDGTGTLFGLKASVGDLYVLCLSSRIVKFISNSRANAVIPRRRVRKPEKMGTEFALSEDT